VPKNLKAAVVLGVRKYLEELMKEEEVFKSKLAELQTPAEKMQLYLKEYDKWSEI